MHIYNLLIAGIYIYIILLIIHFNNVQQNVDNVTNLSSYFY